MVRLGVAFRHVRPGRPHPIGGGDGGGGGGGGGGGAITLTFVAATTDSEAGVFGVVGGTNANQQFNFNEIAPRTGLPLDLEISESSTLKLVITFPADYAGAAYTYIDTSGASHAGTFPATNGTVNY